MYTMHEQELRQHATILGWLYIVGHALFVVIGVFVFVLLTGIGAAVDDPVAPRVLITLGTAVGLLLVALGLPGLAAGYGLLMRRPWARVLAMVVGILNLVNFPVGTAIGLYTIWALSQPGVADYFGQAKTAPGGT